MLIETLPAAFQMAEIIHALGEHSYGLNAGRWDYIFSMIKVFREDPDFVLPDRNDVKMTVPFMRAYTELLVKTCHEHGAFAMGGMAALIPSRSDEAANQRAIEAVKADKEREAKAGFDGTWVAHPDVVDVALAAFDEVLGDRPNQIDKQRYDVDVSPEQLLDASSTPGEITEEGLRCDVNVGFQYISFWLGGRGAAGINNLMEDAATAEISRSQIWQWVRHGTLRPRPRAQDPRRGDGEDPRRGGRRDLAEGPPRRDQARSSSGSRSRTSSPTSSRCRHTSTSTDPSRGARGPGAPISESSDALIGRGATGEERWRASGKSDVDRVGDLLLLHAADGSLRALDNASGKERWRIPGAGYGPPVVRGADVFAYLRCAGACVVEVHELATGERRWSAVVPGATGDGYLGAPHTDELWASDIVLLRPSLDDYEVRDIAAGKVLQRWTATGEAVALTGTTIVRSRADGTTWGVDARSGDELWRRDADARAT